LKAKEAYRVVAREQALDEGRLGELLADQGQLLLPVMELIVSGQAMIDGVVDQIGRGMIQAILELSARDVAGRPHRGKPDDTPDAPHRFGYQRGVVKLSDRNLQVRKPRLRTRPGAGKSSREVPVPAYELLREHPDAGEHVLRLLARGVSTRDYRTALREIAGTVGVSKSSVSREFIERTEKAHDELMARRFDEEGGVDIMVIYIDGQLFGQHHAITALGIDSTGKKHILGVVHGGSENAAAVKRLLHSLVERGLSPDVPRLFVIDGSKAIRAAITEVFGSDSPVQRCVAHKVRNVQDELPEEKKAYAKMLINAAVKMAPGEGLPKLKAYAKELDVAHPGAAASLREGMEDLFTVSRLNLPDLLARSLRTTNVIESPQGLITRFTGRVKNWQTAEMVLRWQSAACLDAEQRMHRIAGYKHMDLLKHALRPGAARQRRSA
jgi:putative transposase